MAALGRCTKSGREIAAEMTRRGLPVSHTTVNRWLAGQLPRLDEAVLLAEVAGIDLDWVLYGEGPPPWELTRKHHHILWLVGVLGLDRAAERLAAAKEVEGYPLDVRPGPEAEAEAETRQEPPPPSRPGRKIS